MRPLDVGEKASAPQRELLEVAVALELDVFADYFSYAVVSDGLTHIPDIRFLCLFSLASYLTT